MIEPRKKETAMAGKRIRRPVEDEALSRITRWEKRAKKGGFDVAYFREFARYPVFAEEPIKENEIGIRDN